MEGEIVAVLTAVISLFGVVVGIALSQAAQRKRLRSEELRWYSDELLTRKIKALVELYEQLVDMYFTIGDAHIKWLFDACDEELEDGDRLETIRQARPEIDELIIGGMTECSRHLRYASIYLSEKQVEQIQTLLDRYANCLGDLGEVLHEVRRTLHSETPTEYMRTGAEMQR